MKIVFIGHGENFNQMSIQAVCIARDISKPISPWEYRQWPGKWPLGNSQVGNCIFIPPINGEFLGDWLVCLTPPPPVIKTTIPKEKRIFFMMETPDFWSPEPNFLDQFGCVVSPYTISNFSGFQVNSVTTGLFWWYGISMKNHTPGNSWLCFDEIQSEAFPEKNKLISTITSSKLFLPGHKKRFTFTHQLKDYYGDKLDLFGSDINPITDKRDGLVHYKYHIAIENSIYPHYWTEKLSDPLLARCIVFYAGASEIGQYFSNKIVIPINIENFDETIKIIDAHLNENSNPIEEIEESRKKMLYDFNFPFFCDELIKYLIKKSEIY